MTHRGGGRYGRRGCVAIATILASVISVCGEQSWHAAASSASPVMQHATIVRSPRPFFLQSGGAGPAIWGDRLVWTATTGQGATGSNADRIYLYDLAQRRLTVPVRSRFGAVGFIGSYVLVGDRLAYVDTGFAPGGIFTWNISLYNFASGQTQTVAVSTPGVLSSIPPQIAYDGARLLVVEMIDLPGLRHEGIVTLYTGSTWHRATLHRVSDRLLGDPALPSGAALWTETTLAAPASSRLLSYDLRREHLRVLPVGSVSQVAASGDTVVWKSGPIGTGGSLTLYSMRRQRVLVPDLAHSATASYPATNGALITWTSGDSSRVQVYSIAAKRIIYTTPLVAQRVYGLSAVVGREISWVYTTLPTTGQGARGYIVVCPLRYQSQQPGPSVGDYWLW